MVLKSLILFFSSAACLYGEGFTPSLSALGEKYPLSNLEGEPSSVVGGCVNVISGDFFEFQRDLVLEGPEPLVLERYYSSSDSSCGTLHNGWHLNHQGTVIVRDIPIGNPEDPQVEYLHHVEYKGPFGSEIRFDDSCGRGMMGIHQDVLKRGVTNCGSGQISSRTNLKNLRLSLKKHGATLKRKGNGKLKFSGKLQYFNLVNEKKPSGICFEYGYKGGRLKQVTALNNQKQALQALTFEYFEEKGADKHRPRVIVNSHDGRTVTYKFQKFLDADYDINDEERFCLHEVFRPNGPSETYYYERQSEKKKHLERVIKKELPESRYLEIGYYKIGKNYPPGSDAIQYDQNHPAINRVKSLKGPIGSDAASHTIYRFGYHLPFGREGAGWCNVYDAKNNRTDYHWDGELRLKAIVKYDQNQNSYVADNFAWGAAGSANHSNLLSHTYTAGEGHQFCRCYHYDGLGNVTHDCIYGNLSGENPVPLSIDSSGYPIENGCERYVKIMRYTPDGSKLEYESDGRHKKTYTYHQGTDRIASILTWNGDLIALRQAFIYDENGALIFEFIDDGPSKDLSDLTGATLRKSKFLNPRKTFPIGLPDQVEERVLDVATGQDSLIRAFKNFYSREGWLTIQEEYDGNGSHVNTQRWEYNNEGKIILEVNVLGEAIRRKFDANGNLMEEIGPGNKKKVFLYDFANRLILEGEEHPGRALYIHYEYNKLGQKIAMVDPFGNRTTYQYDEFGRLVETVKPLVRSENGEIAAPVTKWGYDPMGNPTSRIDHQGYATRAAYNIRGQPYRIEYPDGSVEKNIYSPEGLLIKSVAKNGLTTCYAHDYQDRVIRTECFSQDGALLWTTSASYNAFHLLSEVDALGYATNYTYDHFGRLKVKQKGESSLSYEYDAKGRVVKTFTRLNAKECSVKVIAYDLLDRVMEERIENEAGDVLSCEHYLYDSEGRRIEEQRWGDDQIHYTKIHYNSYGTPAEVIDSMGYKTITIDRFDYYNELGQLVGCQEVTDPLGNVTIKIKDAHYRDAALIRKNALGQTIQKTEYVYDLIGNRKQEIETVFFPDGLQKQIQHSWTYDGMQRCTTFVEASGDPDEKRTHYHYNQFGELEELQKPSGVSLFYSYDTQGLLVDYCAKDQSFHYSYVYDIKQRPIEIKDRLTNLSTMKCFDENDRLIKVKSMNGQVLEYTYDEGGRVLETKLPDQSRIVKKYDSVHLKSIARVSPEKKILYTHTYDRFDLSGKVLEETYLGTVGKLFRKFDPLGRLVVSETAKVKENIPVEGFDGNGNLLKRILTDPLGEVACSYSYDDLNQMTSEAGVSKHQYLYDSIYNRISKDGQEYKLNNLNQVLAAHERNFTYDLNGNLVEQSVGKKSRFSYRYDALDRLVEVKGSKFSVRYGYDADNHRISKTVREGKKETITYYLYDGDNEIGAVDAKGKIIQLRVLGTGLGAEIGAAVAVELNGSVYAPLHDHHGNVVAIVNPNGQIKESYRYTAFGEEQIYNEKGKVVGKAINPWRFSSKRFDEETGFTFFGRRYYLPLIGKWITKDPSGYNEGPNLYAYVTNSPLTLFDLYGLVAEGLGMWDRVRDSVNRVKENVVSFVKEVAHTVGKVLHRAVHHTGHLVYDVGHNCVPLPILKDIPMFVGHLMMGGNPSSYIMSFKQARSTHDMTIGNEPMDTQLGFISGQMNTHRSSNKTASLIGKAFGNVQTNYVGNQTFGFITDTLASIFMKFNGNLHVVDEAISMIKELLTKTKKNVELFVHSQGALVVHQALQVFTTSELNRITLHAFGPAKILPKGQLKDCRNYVSIFDPIPFISDALGMVKSAFLSDYKVEFLSPEMPFYDHFIDSGPYEKRIRQIGKFSSVRNDF